MKASKILKKARRRNRLKDDYIYGEKMGNDGASLGMTSNSRTNFVRSLVANRIVSRAALSRVMNGDVLDDWDELDEECRYPSHISMEMYKKIYYRDPYANRAVGFFSRECWALCPNVYETEKVESKKATPFEKGYKKLAEVLNLESVFGAFDEKAGIGYYSLLLIGFSDNSKLSQPVKGIDENGDPTGRKKKKLKINYLTHFDCTQAKILERNTNRKSKRFGLPTFYGITMADPEDQLDGKDGTDYKEHKVHWSRVIHCPSDGGNLVWGPPRLQCIFNNLLNIRKILGGSAEMFWKGGFPGMAFEIPADLAGEVELDKKELEKEITKYYRRLKRYLALDGVVAKPLNPNIADPDSAVDVQVTAICVALGIAKRMFMGTEEARLASLTDAEGTNRRVHRRQNVYCVPFILRPFIDRCIATGVLPEPEQVIIKWPDVYSVGEKDRASITKDLVAALAQYTQSGAQQIFPELQFFTMIMDLTSEQAEEVIAAAKVRVKQMKKDGTLVRLNPGDKVMKAGQGGAGSMRPGQVSAKGSKAPSKQPKGGGKRIERKPKKAA
jgi:hypothetical protein